MGKWKAASIIVLFVMLMNCLLALGPLEEVGPVTLVWLAVTHLVLRAPYSRLRFWELPLAALSMGCATFGSWSFQPEGLFFAVFVTLAWCYGFACTASAPDTRRFSRYSLPFVDFGLVLAPFLFPLLVLRYFLGVR